MLVFGIERGAPHMSNSPDKPTAVTQLVVKPRDARQMLACSNTRLYELISEQELESFRDGRSRKITVESIHHYIARRLRTTEGQAKGRGRREARAKRRGNANHV